MLKDYFIGIVKNAVLKAIENNELGETKEINFELICDKPKNKDFGDFAINISALSKTARMAPAVIAQTIVKYIQQENFSINVVQGFINFKLENKFLNEIILQILSKKENYLKTNIGNNKKVTAGIDYQYGVKDNITFESRLTGDKIYDKNGSSVIYRVPTNDALLVSGTQKSGAGIGPVPFHALIQIAQFTQRFFPFAD